MRTGCFGRPHAREKGIRATQLPNTSLRPCESPFALTCRRGPTVRRVVALRALVGCHGQEQGLTLVQMALHGLRCRLAYWLLRSMHALAGRRVKSTPLTAVIRILIGTWQSFFDFGV